VGGGGLCAESMLNLQRVLAISGAEVVLSGRARVLKELREAEALALGRYVCVCARACACVCVCVCVCVCAYVYTYGGR
jgi:hypothetical protein